jgi:hypothetical protein
MYEHHTYGTPFGSTISATCGNLEARKAAYRLHCSNHIKKSDWGHFAIFKMATEDFQVLLAPSDSILMVFDRKGAGGLYPSIKKWLSETEAWLDSDT